MAPRNSVVVVVVVLGGCGFSLDLANTGDDGVPDGTQVALTDTETADFTGVVVDGTIAARGAIEPDAYVTGGLHAKAYMGSTVRSTYAETVASVGAFRGEGYRQLPNNFDSTEGRPKGLGINDFERYTILYDGELYIPAGEVAFDLSADDQAIVEIALDGTNFSTTIVDRFDSDVPPMTVTVPAAGWYPIRAAYTEDIGSAFFDLYYTPAGLGQVHVDVAHTRARVTHGGGLLVTPFRSRRLVNQLGGQASVPTVDANFMSAEPRFDLNIPVDDFALRYNGQIRIDTAGMYTFSGTASTNDQWRIWIDGRAITGTAAKLPSASATIDLEAGWHDFGVDFSDENGDANVHVKMEGPGIPEAAIDPERLRPAVATGFTTGFALQNQTIIMDATGQAPTTTTVPAMLTGPPGAKIVAVDWGFGIRDARFTDLTAMRVDCTVTGTPIAVENMPKVYVFPADTSCANAEFPLEWAYRVTDSQNGGGVGNLFNPFLVATYAGGDRYQPFAKTTTYTSPPRSTPGAIGWGRVALDAQPRGGTVTLTMRSGATEAELDAANWIAVADGDVPTIAASELVQYRVTMTSDGWQFPTVERVEVVYVVRE